MKYVNKAAILSLVATLLVACSDGTGPKGPGIFALVSVNSEAVPLDIVTGTFTSPFGGSGPEFHVIGSGTLDMTRPNRWVRTIKRAEAEDGSFPRNPPAPPSAYATINRDFTDSGTYVRTGNTISFSPEANIPAFEAEISSNTLTYTAQFAKPSVQPTFVWQRR